MKVKIGFANLEGGVVELDYTSQLNKDIHKRREKLFRLQLSNAMEFLLQAPSDKQASNWYVCEGDGERSVRDEGVRDEGVRDEGVRGEGEV